MLFRPHARRGTLSLEFVMLAALLVVTVGAALYVLYELLQTTLENLNVQIGM